MPSFLWLFRNWEDSGIDVEPTKDYVMQQVARVDESLVAYFTKFAQFDTLDLPRPVLGKFTGPMTNLVPEYKDRVATCQGLLHRFSCHKSWSSAQAFLLLCTGLEAVVNESDFVPDVVTQACAAVRDTIIRDAVLHSCPDFTESPLLPLDDDGIATVIASAFGTARNTFHRNLAGVVLPEDEEHAMRKLEDKVRFATEGLTKRNHDRCVIVCQSLIAPLQEHYLDIVRKIALPQRLATIDAIHKECRDEILLTYENKVQGTTLRSVRQEDYEALYAMLERFQAETKKENAYKSELLCEKYLVPAEKVGVVPVETYPVSDRLLAVLQARAVVAAKDFFLRNTESCTEHIVKKYEAELEVKITATHQAQVQLNVSVADKITTGRVKSLVEQHFHDTIRTTLASTVLPKDALDQLFKSAQHRLAEEFDEETKKYVDLVAEGSGSGSLGPVAVSVAQRRMELLQDSRRACEEFEAANNLRAAAATAAAAAAAAAAIASHPHLRCRCPWPLACPGPSYLLFS